MIDGLLALRERYHEQVRSARSSGLLATLLDELFRVPSITIGRAGQVLSVTPATASANIRRLQRLGWSRK